MVVGHDLWGGRRGGNGTLLLLCNLIKLFLLCACEGRGWNRYKVPFYLYVCRSYLYLIKRRRLWCETNARYECAHTHATRRLNRLMFSLNHRIVIKLWVFALLYRYDISKRGSSQQHYNHEPDSYFPFMATRKKIRQTLVRPSSAPYGYTIFQNNHLFFLDQLPKY